MRRSGLLILCLILTACGQASSSPSPAVTQTPPEIVDPTLSPTTTAEQVLEIARAMLPEAEGELGQPATLGDPMPVFRLSPQALRAYTPGTPVASLLDPRAEWMMPVLGNRGGRHLMTVGFEEGRWRVIGFGGQDVEGRKLALLQQEYADRYDAITLIKADEVGGLLALVTEGEREALIFLRDVSYLFPELRENPLQVLPPAPVMAKLRELVPSCAPEGTPAATPPC